MSGHRLWNEYRKLCATKTGRAEVSRKVMHLADKCGAQVLECNVSDKDRETYIKLSFGPYRVAMHLEGSGSPGAFLGHWHMEGFTNAKYPADFGVAIRGSLNTITFGKATTCEETLERFLESLERGFTALKALVDPVAQRAQH